MNRVSLAVFVVLAALVAAACEQVPLLAPRESTITVSAPVGALPVGGSTSITAFVGELGGTPVQNGTLVRFTATLGRVDPAEVETRGGTATTTFIAGNSSGTAQIRATSGGATGGTGTAPTNLVEIQVGAAAASAVAVSASPSRVPSSGGQVTIIASTVDASGNRLLGVPITFTSTSGTLSSSSATTNSNGEASVTLTTNREAVVTARAGDKTAQTTVTVGAAATLTLATSPASPLAGSLVTLTMTPATGTQPRVVVTWGDGTTEDLGIVAAQRSVTHSYRQSGSYTIAATATQDGEALSTSTSVTVGSAAGVTLGTPSPTNPVSGTPVTLTVTPATGTAPRVVMSWGDGTTSDLGTVTAARAASHTYTTAGSYIITATATAGGDTFTTSTSVTVSSGASVTLTDPTPASPQVGSPVTLTITPTAGTAPRVVVAWNDGSQDELGILTGPRSVTHTYQTAGAYSIAVTATAGGDTFTVTKVISVNARPPVSLTVSASPAQPDRCQPVVFTATVTESISSYLWTIDSNVNSEDTTVTTTGNTLTRAFLESGTKTVSVTATTPDGRTGNGQTQVVVKTTPLVCP